MSSSIGGHTGSVKVEAGGEEIDGLGESELGKARESHVKKATINDTSAALTLGSERDRRNTVLSTDGVRPELDSEGRWEPALVDTLRALHASTV